MGLQERDGLFDGMRVHYWEGGAGYPLLLIHGSGPGASTLGNWRLVLEPLAERYHVIAGDLIGFGLSDRKPVQPYFDFELWYRQARWMLDLFEDASAGVVGHSISGAIALRLAARDPRIAKVLTTGSMGARFQANRHTKRIWTFPDTRDELRAVGETLVYDKSAITDAYLDGRMKVLHAAGYRDYFRAMFAEDPQTYIDAATLAESELALITAETVMIHGRDDLPFPFHETTEALAQCLPLADIVAFGRCGHSPALEHPAKFLSLAFQLFG